MAQRISVRPRAGTSRAHTEEGVVAMHMLTKLNAPPRRPLPQPQPGSSLAALALIQLARNITDFDIEVEDIQQRALPQPGLLETLLATPQNGQTDEDELDADPRLWAVIALLYTLPQSMTTCHLPLSDPYVTTLNALHLVVLDLSKHPGALDDANVLAIRSLTRLVVLDLGRNIGITGYGLRKLIWSENFGRELRGLLLNGCKGVDEKTVGEAAKVWQKLEVIDVRGSRCFAGMRIPGFMKPTFDQADKIFHPRTALKIARSIVGISEPLVHVNSLDFVPVPPRRAPSAIPMRASGAPTNLNTLPHNFSNERRGPRQRYDVQLPLPHSVQRDAVEVLTFNDDGVQTASASGLAPIIHGSQRERELADIQERRRRLSAIFADGAGATNGGISTGTSSFNTDRSQSAPVDLTSLVLRGMRHTESHATVGLPSATSARSLGQPIPANNTIQRVSRRAEASNPRPTKRLRHTSPSPTRPTDSSAEARSRFFDRLALDVDKEAELMFIRDPNSELESTASVSSGLDKALIHATLPARAKQAPGGLTSVISHVVRAASAQTRQPPAIAIPAEEQRVTSAPPTVRRVPFGKGSSGPPRFKATSLQSGSSIAR